MLYDCVQPIKLCEGYEASPPDPCIMKAVPLHDLDDVGPNFFDILILLEGQGKCVVLKD